MMSGSYAVILVYSTSQAIRVERLLAKAGVPGRLIPVPGGLSSDSGVCVRIHAYDREMAVHILQANGARIEAIHAI